MFMQIHEITAPVRKAKKTIGRGGKRGTYSGRGCKGQKARSGGQIDPLFEGGRTSLIDTLKKVRGFASPHQKMNVITLAQLEHAYNDGETVSRATLTEKGLVRTKTLRHGIKIVATGTLTKKLTLDTDTVAATATAKKLFDAKK